MGLFDRFLGLDRPIAERMPRISALGEAGMFYSIDDPRIIDFVRDGAATKSGKSVTERSAVRNSTFFRAINVISSSIGMLPCHLHEKDKDGNREKASDHPLYKLIHRKPNHFQTPLNFKSYMQGRLLIDGNAYALKIPGARRSVAALIPLDPKRVSVELNDRWEPVYKWKDKEGQPRELKRDQIMHLKAPWSSDGITGDGLIRVAAEALGLAESADEAISRLMKHGSFIGAILEHPKILGEEAQQKLRRQFDERYEGTTNAGKTMLLEEGMKLSVPDISGRDAQGVEQRKFQAEEVSRYTGVPRPLLMFDETSWGTGIEQLGLFFITYCLMPWFVAWEEALSESLLTESERERYFFKFNEGALLRGSLKDQAEFFSKALGGPGAAGFMVPNEARNLMDMNDIEGGDEPAWGMKDDQTEPNSTEQEQ